MDKLQYIPDLVYFAWTVTDSDVPSQWTARYQPTLWYHTVRVPYPVSPSVVCFSHSHSLSLSLFSPRRHLLKSIHPSWCQLLYTLFSQNNQSQPPFIFFFFFLPLPPVTLFIFSFFLFPPPLPNHMICCSWTVLLLPSVSSILFSLRSTITVTTVAFVFFFYFVIFRTPRNGLA